MNIFFINTVFFKFVFNYFWLHWVFLATHRLLIVVASLVVGHGF